MSTVLLLPNLSNLILSPNAIARLMPSLLDRANKHSLLPLEVNVEDDNYDSDDSDEVLAHAEAAQKRGADRAQREAVADGFKILPKRISSLTLTSVLTPTHARILPLFPFLHSLELSAKSQSGLDFPSSKELLLSLINIPLLRHLNLLNSLGAVIAPAEGSNGDAPILQLTSIEIESKTMALETVTFIKSLEKTLSSLSLTVINSSQAVWENARFPKLESIRYKGPLKTFVDLLIALEPASLTSVNLTATDPYRDSVIVEVPADIFLRHPILRQIDFFDHGQM